MKHRTLGNQHAEDSKQAALEAQGWVKFPRTAEQHAAWPDFYAEPVVVVCTEEVASEQAPVKVKGKPGRKPKQ